MYMTVGHSVSFAFFCYVVQSSSQEESETTRSEANSTTEETETTLSESKERQLLADLEHMKTASNPVPPTEKRVRVKTSTTKLTTKKTEEGAPHWWERFPETKPITRARTYSFSARSEAVAQTMNTTTKSTTFRFTKVKHRMPSRLAKKLSFEESEY